MTRRQFYSEFKKIGHLFSLSPGPLGLIRGRIDRHRCVCPITGVYWAKTGTYLKIVNWDVASRYLKLSHSDAWDIMLAADSLRKARGLRKFQLKRVRKALISRMKGEG